jgi:hypothetical protein
VRISCGEAGIVEVGLDSYLWGQPPSAVRHAKHAAFNCQRVGTLGGRPMGGRPHISQHPTAEAGVATRIHSRGGAVGHSMA